MFIHVAHPKIEVPYCHDPVPGGVVFACLKMPIESRLDCRFDESLFSLPSEIERECNYLLNNILYCTFQDVTCHQQGDIKLFVHPVVEVADRNDRNSQKQFSPQQKKYLREKLFDVISLRDKSTIEGVISTMKENVVERTFSNYVRYALPTPLQRDEPLILVRSIVLPSCRILGSIKFFNGIISFGRVIVKQKV